MPKKVLFSTSLDPLIERPKRDAMGIVVNAAHALSQRIRKRIEKIFGWIKTTGCFRKSRYRGIERTHAAGQYVVATLNLLRLAKLQAA